MLATLIDMVRTAVLGAAILLAGCFHNDRGELVSNTTTTGYTTAGTERPTSAGAGCTDLHSHIEFAPRSSELTLADRGDIVQWATCLNRPELQGSTVLLFGGQDPDPDHSIFVQRANRIRAALMTYGVDESRILVASPNAVREGGRLGPSDSVQIDFTGCMSIRNFH